MESSFENARRRHTDATPDFKDDSAANLDDELDYAREQTRDLRWQQAQICWRNGCGAAQEGRFVAASGLLQTALTLARLSLEPTDNAQAQAWLREVEAEHARCVQRVQRTQR